MVLGILPSKREQNGPGEVRRLQHLLTGTDGDIKPGPSGEWQVVKYSEMESQTHGSKPSSVCYHCVSHLTSGDPACSSAKWECVVGRLE